MPLIYCVEDDENIRELVGYALRSQDFEVETFADSKEFWPALEKRTPALLLLDIMLPGESGNDILDKLRKTQQYKTLPVIMLTARGEEYDKLAGLEGGADDYVVKPFSPRELVARVKVVLARTMPKTQEGGESFVFGDLVIDTASHSVKIAGEEAPLTPKEFDLLVFLVSNKGLALSREKILQKVWNYDYYGEDRTVDTHVKMLRSHLGKYRDNIVTVWGIGYKFDPDVRPGK